MMPWSAAVTVAIRQRSVSTTCRAARSAAAVSRTNGRDCILWTASLGERIQSDHLSRANTSGIRGVYFNKKRGKCYYLGGYADIQEAAKARHRAEEEIFGNCLKWYQEICEDVSEKELG